MAVTDLHVLTSILGFQYTIGDFVQKKSGSYWKGTVVGYYSTKDTPEGYCVQLPTLKGNGPVQIYPVSALESWDGEDAYRSI